MASWWAILTPTWRRLRKDNLSALAAGAAFQALLTIFPTLTAVVSLYGLVADPNMVERQITAMQGVLPPEAVKLITTWLQALVQGPATRFGIGLIVSVLLAFWSMWSATGVLMTAINICYGEEEKRGFVSFNLHALVLGAGLALFGTAALALVAVLPAALALQPSSGGHHSASLVLSDRLRHPRRGGIERGDRASNYAGEARSGAGLTRSIDSTLAAMPAPDENSELAQLPGRSVGPSAQRS